jgi:hypothetical protein
MYVTYPDGSTNIVKKIRPRTRFYAYQMRQKPMLETGGAIIKFRVKIDVDGESYDIPAMFASSEIRDIDINTFLKFDE